MTANKGVVPTTREVKNVSPEKANETESTKDLPRSVIPDKTEFRGEHPRKAVDEILL